MVGEQIAKFQFLGEDCVNKLAVRVKDKFLKKYYTCIRLL